jgi:hypothetical protein
MQNKREDSVPLRSAAFRLHAVVRHVQWSELKHCIYSTVSAMHFDYLIKGDRPTIASIKTQIAAKKTQLKLNNKPKNELNQKLEAAGGV